MFHVMRYINVRYLLTYFTSKQPDENSDESTTAESRDRLRTVVSSSNGTASIGWRDLLEIETQICFQIMIDDSHVPLLFCHFWISLDLVR